MATHRHLQLAGASEKDPSLLLPARAFSLSLSVLDFGASSESDGRFSRFRSCAGLVELLGGSNIQTRAGEDRSHVTNSGPPHKRSLGIIVGYVGGSVGGCSCENPNNFNSKTMIYIP